MTIMKRILTFFITAVLASYGGRSVAQLSVSVSSKSWPERIAQSFLSMHPDSVNYPNEAKSRRWNYEQGLMLEALFHMWQYSEDSLYLRYIIKNLDYYIEGDGSIRTYRPEELQLDNIAPGKVALRLYEMTREPKYRIAADTLRRQLSVQPRTPEGGFWHKKIYPNQMWLDGLYMVEPFYAYSAELFGDTTAFDDIAKQFSLIRQHCYDPRTGLYFHVWDESKQQRWANPETGCSPNFWGRSIGWLAMALVDVLDYYPENRPERTDLLRMLNDLSASLLKQRDEKTKLWYQVIDKPDVKGNYPEASASAMFVYTFARGANRGYLPADFRARAEESFQGILKYLVSIDSSGIVHLEHVCSVSGLGGNPYRDGSVAYYLSEPQRTDDFKGYGPFLMAAIELDNKGD
jgi:unsaturated rhamnogalacturonyl hydrolase